MTKPQFHGTGGEIRNGNEVRFWKGKLDVKVSFEKGQRFGGNVQRSDLVRSHHGGKDTNINASISLGTNMLKLANHECKEIG